MNKNDYSKQLAGAALALCALVGLGSTAAHAGALQITNPSQLGPPPSLLGPTFTTGNTPLTPGTYPGAPETAIASGFTLSAGPVTTVQFNALDTSTNPSSSDVFSRLDSTGPLGDGSDIDYPVGTETIETSDLTNFSTGPLELNFSTAGLGVAGFGVQVQDYATDQETFTVALGLNGASASAAGAPTFTYGPVDNTGLPRGASIFVGAAGTNGDLITSAIISDMSVDNVTTMFQENFFAGPVVITNVPVVPEASTVISLGMGLFLFAGMAFTARKRQVSRES